MKTTPLKLLGSMVPHGSEHQKVCRCLILYPSRCCQAVVTIHGRERHTQLPSMVFRLLWLTIATALCQTRHVLFASSACSQCSRATCSGQWQRVLKAIHWHPTGEGLGKAQGAATSVTFAEARCLGMLSGCAA